MNGGAPLKKENDGVQRVHLKQKRDQWRAFVNTVMNFLFP
jgi:hypothetical protein